MKGWEVVVMIETWVDEKVWEKVRGLPGEYKWGVQFASRIYRKGRAKRGMIMRIKWDTVEKGKEIDTKTEGIITGMVKVEKET